MSSPAVHEWLIVEKHNHNHLHGVFESEVRANSHLTRTIPEYVAQGFFSDKRLTADDFEVIEVNSAS